MRLLVLSITASLCFVYVSSAQMTVNVESLRKKIDSAQWAGDIGLRFNLTKNKNDQFSVSTNVGFFYNDKVKHLWMLISKINFNKIEGQSYANSGLQHFRYNRTISNKTKLEVFLQGQYDAISEIKFRGLAGLGPRFKLSKESHKKNKIYLGTLIMYEYEKNTEIGANEIHNDIRGSNYLSFNFNPSSRINITSTTYFQPKIDLLKDYRISTQTSFEIKLFEKTETYENNSEKILQNLSLNISFSYEYDSFPVSTIPKTQYGLTNGLTYSF